MVTAMAAMTKSEQRRIALGAARGYLRQQQIDPVEVSAEEALTALSDFPLIDKRLIAGIWFTNCTKNQVNLFVKEWENWRKQKQLLSGNNKRTDR